MNAEKFLAAITEDILSANGIPGVSTLTTAINSYKEKQKEKAREIFLDELREGMQDISFAGDIDEHVGVWVRYERAAEEGTARLNLRLMAQVMAGSYIAEPIKIDDFLYYADILAALRREEIILLGRLYASHADFKKVGNDDKTSEVEALKSVKKDLIPAVFSDDDDVVATCAAITRTGLLLERTAAIGGQTFKPTNLLKRLAQYINIDEALKKEGQQ